MRKKTRELESLRNGSSYSLNSGNHRKVVAFFQVVQSLLRGEVSRVSFAATNTSPHQLPVHLKRSEIQKKLQAMTNRDSASDELTVDL